MLLPGPKHLMDMEELQLGDLIEQPDFWIDAAKILLKEKKPVWTKIYKDDWNSDYHFRANNR